MGSASSLLVSRFKTVFSESHLDNNSGNDAIARGVVITLRHCFCLIDLTGGHINHLGANATAKTSDPVRLWYLST